MLARIGGICRYVVEGRNYFHMPKWHHQKINRPTPAKSPPCPLHENGGSGHVLDIDESVSPQGAITEPSGGERKGREGKGKDLLSDESDETDNRFDEFWDVYDKKEGRKTAESRWKSALKKRSVTADSLIAAAGSYIDWQKREGKHPQYTKLAATWLTGEHWNDERPSAEPSNVHRLPHASEVELPPDGLTPQEYAEWHAAQRAKRNGGRS